MPAYTVSATCAAELTGREKRQILNFSIAVFRDGVEIRQFVQSYGEAVKDAEVREDLELKIIKVIREDYDELARVDLAARCVALEAVVSDFTRTLP